MDIDSQMAQEKRDWAKQRTEKGWEATADLPCGGIDVTPLGGPTKHWVWCEVHMLPRGHNN